MFGLIIVDGNFHSGLHAFDCFGMAFELEPSYVPPSYSFWEATGLLKTSLNIFGVHMKTLGVSVKCHY
jgi:hypothetical protein